MTPEQVARFWAKVDKSGECWLWTGARDSRGYGRVKVNGKMEAAHRQAWKLVHGPIPPGKQVLHKCDNPPCVRHLFLGTHADNMQDKTLKGRAAQRLTAQQVYEIRTIWAISQRYGIKQRLAREYGVTHATISRIVHGKTWAHTNP